MIFYFNNRGRFKYFIKIFDLYIWDSYCIFVLRDIYFFKCLLVGMVVFVFGKFVDKNLNKNFVV